MIRAMADSDSVFLWETEALRSSKPAVASSEPPHVQISKDDSDWLTLREATELTGIPISTLRKWARRESVPTYLDETPVGQLRMVSLKGIRKRAEQLGRNLSHNRPTQVEVQRAKPPSPSPSPSSEPEQTREAGQPRDEDEADSGPDIPEGTMLVPLDAWNKMLMQLGNLHEAGQQLADARERAAKAETETVFLRERLSEMRDELAEAKDSRPRIPIVIEPVPETEPEPEETPVAETEPEKADEAPVPEMAENEESLSTDIPVRNLGNIGSPDELEPAPDQEDLLTLPAYSLAMMKHVYTTWRGRPRR